VRRLALGVLLLMSATVAPAICPMPTPKVCSAFFESDAVFAGTVTSAEVVPEKDDFIEGWRYHLRVARVFRGVVGHRVVVHTSNDSGRLQLAVGREYLLFASLRNRQLEIGDDCGPLSNPTNAAQVIREIERLRDARDAVIEGEVRADTASGPGAPDVNIQVLGMGRSYAATSDARGAFHMAVQPGRYRIDVDSRVVAVSDYSRTNLSKVVLVRGQCAQVQFIKH
jgi:hypothetical protein